MRKYVETVLEDYDSYQKKARDGIGLEEANSIFQEYYQSMDLSDPDICSMYQEFVTDAIRYAAIRAEWSCMDREERIREDGVRTNLHDKVINDFEQYVLYLNRNGIPTPWADRLMQGIDISDVKLKRKRIGDWACFISLFVSLNNR